MDAAKRRATEGGRWKLKMKHLGIVSVITLQCLFAALAVLFDAGFAVSLQLGFYLFAVIPLFLALLVWRAQSVRITSLAYLAILLILPFVNFTPVKPFTRFYSQVHLEMTEDDVIKTLNLQFPEGGRFPRPISSRSDNGYLSFVLDPNDGAYNAEIISLKMKDGRVSKKEYFPD